VKPEQVLGAIIGVCSAVLFQAYNGMFDPSQVIGVVVLSIPLTLFFLYLLMKIFRYEDW